ncbi:MAG TPA: hypothetical protein VMS30_04805 [Phycisphaerales bacterium]|nr:hypothetical protein [Phycisphaerales bacterium]
MRTACTLASFTVFTSLLVAPSSPVAAQQNPPARGAKAVAGSGAAPGAATDALVVYSAGADALLSDPKDAGLLRALKMLDERVLELPREVEDESMPAPAIQLALQLLMSPMSLRAGLLDMNAQPDGPPFYGQISFYGPADSAADFAGRFNGMLAQHGAPPASPAQGMPGMQTVDADGVPLYFGTMKAGNGSAFVLGVNRVGAADMPSTTTGLPKDVKPVFAGRLDVKQLQPLMDMMLAQAGEEAEMVRAHLAASGMYGPDAGELTFAAGHGKDRCYGWGTFTNYRKALESSGLLAESALTAADLKRVPADASYAQVGKTNLSGMLKMLGAMAGEAMKRQGAGGEEAAADPFKFIEDATGIHPQRDIVDHLGQTMGMYMSDSSGGGGLASTVLFVEVKNPEGLEATRARIRGMINQIGQDKARGYVRVAERDVNGSKVLALTFPGLPVPLEICSTVTDGWLYVAASPGALTAAIEQAKSGKNSLADNPRFKEMGGGDLKDAMQVTFVDTPRMIGQGYGLVSLGMTALANAVRSPTDVKRDAGNIMPSFAELSKDAKASVSVTRLVGNDLVVTSQGDRSMLVNACGVAGSMGGMGGAMLVAAMAAGGMSQARQAARPGMSDLLQIITADPRMGNVFRLLN